MSIDIDNDTPMTHSSVIISKFHNVLNSNVLNAF